MKIKIMRTLLLLCASLGCAHLHAADDPTVSKILDHPLASVRTVVETFPAYARTNVALRQFVSTDLGASGNAYAKTNKLGEVGFAIILFDCRTPSPGFEIRATSVSPEKTRIEIYSLDASQEIYRSEFRPKRNLRMLEELVRLVEKKP